MSRLKAFLVLLAFSSICFGATLMQISVGNTLPEIEGKNPTYEKSCQQLIKEHHSKALRQTAYSIYQQAFTETFNGNWKKAQQASTCAAQLFNGTDYWQHETRDWVK